MRTRRIIILFAVFLGLLLVSTYVVLRYTGASKSLVEGLLARFVRSHVDLGDAQVDPTTGRVSLQEIRISNVEGTQPAALRADEISLEVNTNPLDGQSIGSIRRVTIDNLELQVSLDEDGNLNWLDILHLPDGDAGETFPAVVIRNSRFTFQVTTETPPITFTEVQLELLPDAAGSNRMVLSGSMLSPSGFTVSVRGDGNLAAGEFRTRLESTNVPLLPKIARPYSETAERYLEKASFTGLANKAVLWLQYPPAPDDANALTANLTAEIAEVACRPIEFPYPVTGASGRLSASTRGGGHIHFDLAADTGGGSLKARGDFTRCLSARPLIEVRASATEVPVDEQLAFALEHLRPTRDPWRAFDPSGGHCDVELFLQRGNGEEVPDLDLDLTLRGVEGAFYGFPTIAGERPLRFPYKIENVNGLVQIRPSRVVVRNIFGSRRDGGRFELSGSITGLGGGSSEQEIALDIEGWQMAFSDELRDAVDTLIEGGGEIYDTFTPVGVSDVDVRVRKARGDRPPDVRVTLHPLDCSITYTGFPYELGGIRGSIQITGKGTDFDLSGSRGETTVDLSGRYMTDDSETGTQSEMWLHGRKIVLDESLRRALNVLSPDLDAWWEMFDPTGHVDCKLSLWRPVGAEEFEHDLRMDFNDGSIAVKRFGSRLLDVNGSAFVHGTGSQNRLDISVLRGHVDSGSDQPPASVLVEGTMSMTDESHSIDLTTVVRKLDLNDVLAGKLDAAKVFRKSTWDVLAPSGQVDLVNHFTRAVDGAEDQTLRVQLAGVRTDAAILPAPVTNLTGEVLIKNGRGSFETVRGRMATAELTCAGGAFGDRNGRTFLNLTIWSDHLPIDASFANLLTGPLRENFLERRVRGAVRLNGLAMAYQFPTEDLAFETSFEGEMVAKNLNMVMVVPVREISGAWDIAGQVTPTAGTVTATATDLSFNLLGHRVNSGRLEIDANEERIVVDNVSARLHGGYIESVPYVGDDGGSNALVYRFTELGDLSGHLTGRDISLSQFLRAGGQTSPMTRGTISGRLDLEQLTGRNLLDMIADASLEIHNGRLGEVPMFTAIYAFLEPKNRPQFDGAKMRVSIRDRKMVVHELKVTSPLMEVVGKGTVGLDGYLDIVLEFPDLFASAADWLILPRVLNVLTSQVVRFHVYGYLRSPRARPRWLFQDHPARMPVEPIPARSPERAARH